MWNSPNDHPDMSQGQAGYNWMADFVYGGIDGAVTTFAVVAGVEGASLSISIILILGFANLLADGFSMATGKYLSDKAALEQYEKIRQIEFRHLKEKTEHEKAEVHAILADYGLKGDTLARAAKQVIQDPEAWVDLMMRNEFNLTRENTDPKKGALATFTAFVLVGIVPLLAYIFNAVIPLGQRGLFIATSVATLIALFGVGAVKSHFVSRHWILCGLETAFFGGLAAGIAYLVGFLLRGLAS